MAEEVRKQTLDEAIDSLPGEEKLDDEDGFSYVGETRASLMARNEYREEAKENLLKLKKYLL